jgi:hypothetical protein
MVPNFSAKGFGEAFTDGPTELSLVAVPPKPPGRLTGEPAALPTFSNGFV